MKDTGFNDHQMWTKVDIISLSWVRSLDKRGQESDHQPSFLVVLQNNLLK